MSEWSKWLESIYQNKLPLGQWFEVVVAWLHTQFSAFFSALFDMNVSFQADLQAGLARVDPLIWLVILTALILVFSRSILCTILSALTMVLIINLGLWNGFMESLVIWVVALFIGGVLGLAIGLLLSRWRTVRCISYGATFYKTTLSMLVFLVPALALFQTGPVAQFFAAIVIAALFWAMALFQSFADVPKSLMAMGTSLGGSKSQKFYKIELPYAFGSIKNHLGKIALFVWLMVILSGLIGSMGLGSVLIKALLSSDIAAGFEAALVIGLCCMWIFRIFQGCWIKSTSKEVLV